LITQQLTDYIYFRGDNQLWVNQFISSEARWKAAGVTVRQETEFPREAKTRITVSCDKPTKFTLHLRHPCTPRQPELSSGRYLEPEEAFALKAYLRDVALAASPFATYPIAEAKRGKP